MRAAQDKICQRADAVGRARQRHIAANRRTATAQRPYIERTVHKLGDRAVILQRQHTRRGDKPGDIQRVGIVQQNIPAGGEGAERADAVGRARQRGIAADRRATAAQRAGPDAAAVAFRDPAAAGFQRQRVGDGKRRVEGQGRRVQRCCPRRDRARDIERAAIHKGQGMGAAQDKICQRADAVGRARQ